MIVFILFVVKFEIFKGRKKIVELLEIVSIIFWIGISSVNL